MNFWSRLKGILKNVPPIAKAAGRIFADGGKVDQRPVALSDHALKRFAQQFGLIL